MRANVGELPSVPDETDEGLCWSFLWMAVQTARSPAKSIPVKPRRRLSRAQLLELRRTLEHVAHGSRTALAWLNQYIDRFAPEDGKC